MRTTSSAAGAEYVTVFIVPKCPCSSRHPSRVLAHGCFTRIVSTSCSSSVVLRFRRIPRRAPPCLGDHLEGDAELSKQWFAESDIGLSENFCEKFGG